MRKDHILERQLEEIKVSSTIANLEAKLTQVEQDRDRLRFALIETGRNLGAGLTDEVSNEFLSLITKEAGLLRSDRDRLAAEVAQVKDYATAFKQGNEEMHGMIMQIRMRFKAWDTPFAPVSQDIVDCIISHADEELVAAQQSAQEQFRAGVESERERCVKIIGYYSGTEGICDRILRNCSNCGQDECCHWGDVRSEICGSYIKAGETHNPGLATIRAAAKEQFGAATEWPVNHLLANQADCKICETGQRCWECAAAAIREAAKEER